MFLLLRSSFPSSAETYDRSGYFTIFEHPKDIQLHSLSTISINFYICMAYSCRNNSPGKNPQLFFISNKIVIIFIKCSLKILEIHWSSIILINYHTGHVSISSLLLCLLSVMVMYFVRRFLEEHFWCFSSSSVW